MFFRPQNGVRFAASVVWLGILSVSAFAYSARVQSACKGDYYAHCSQFSVGTPEVAQCMRQVGERLSLPCLAALADDGQISKAEIDAYYARQQGKTAAPQVPKAVAVTKANPAAKAAAYTKPALGSAVKSANAPKSVAVPKYKGSAGTTFATAKNYDAPAANDAAPRKLYGKKYSSEPNYNAETKSDQRPARLPEKSIRSDDAVVAKNTKRRSRDDDDGWYDDDYFADRYKPSRNRYAAEYGGAYDPGYGPPDPYMNARNRDYDR